MTLMFFYIKLLIIALSITFHWDLVRLLILKLKKDEYFELFLFRHYMQLHI